MTNYNNSRDDWQEFIERQYNVAPADIIRIPHFRAPGLPRPPLPIAVRPTSIYVGIAFFMLGVMVRDAFDGSFFSMLGTALGAAGLFQMVMAIRWWTKKSRVSRKKPLRKLSCPRSRYGSRSPEDGHPNHGGAGSSLRSE